jgi:Ran GTPase-activating protein (RanGAP) involved in mRNA processing and transport
MELLLQRLSKLQSLSLRLSPSEEESSLVQWAPALQFTQLQVLDLRDNRIGDAGAQALARALPESNIQELVLSWNHFGQKGMEALTRALEKTSLKRLVVGCNENLDDQSLKMLMDQLEQGHHGSLRTLDLFGTQITESTGSRFLQCLEQRQTSLERLILDGTSVSMQIKNQVDYYLGLNRAGRRCLAGQNELSLSAWPYLLAKSSGDSRCKRRSSSKSLEAIYFFLQNKAELTGYI